MALERAITVPQAVALYIGAVLGVGVLILPTVAANEAGPASVLAWVGLGVMSFAVAYMFGRLSSRYPDAGGVAAFADRAFGPRAGGIAGWWFLGASSFGLPIVSLTGASYLGGLFDIGRGQLFLLAGASLGLMVLVNVFGIRVSSRAQLMIAGAIVLGLVIIDVGALPSLSSSEFTPFAPHGWRSVGSAAAVIFMSFVGWEAVSHLAEEFEDPVRGFKIAVSISVLVVVGLYVMASVVTIGTGAYGDDVETVVPLARVAAEAFGESGRVVTSILAFSIALAAMNAYVASASRLIFALARGGFMPRALSGLSARRSTPAAALAALAVVLAGVLIVMYAATLSIGDIILIPNALFVGTYALSSLAALRLLAGSRAGIVAAVVGLIGTGVVVPSLSWYVLAPLGCAIPCLLYRSRSTMEFSAASPESGGAVTADAALVANERLDSS